MDGYLRVSCNGVTDDFEPFSALLAMHKISGRHTGDAIFSLYQSTLKNWRISEKVRLT